MLTELREKVCRSNIELQNQKLVIYNWGNVSGIDRETNIVMIKPSGVGYDELTPDKMVGLDLEGNVVEGELRPSSDTETHLELYRNSSRYSARSAKTEHGATCLQFPLCHYR